MSLTSCLRNAGDSISKENRTAVIKEAARLRRVEKMSADDAARKAVNSMIAGIKAKLAEAKGSPRALRAITFPELDVPYENGREDLDPIPSDERAGLLDRLTASSGADSEMAAGAISRAQSRGIKGRFGTDVRFQDGAVRESYVEKA
jgi:hypothetical protein